MNQIVEQPILKDEDQFDGQYSDSGSSINITPEDNDQDEDMEEQSTKEEIKKKTKKGKKGVKKYKPKKQQKIVINVSDTKYRVVHFVGKKIFQWRLQYDPEATDWDIMWTDNAISTEQIGKLQHHQKVNHFPGMYSLARKNHLGRNLMKLKKQFPEHYKFFPQTWVLPADFNDFKAQFDKKQKGKARTYIAKPEAGCQGKGIFLTRSLDDFNSTDHYVVQRYMHKPYLIDGLKFDLRIYVLLAGCDPLRIYMYEEGLARFSTEEYQAPNRDNLDDLCMHLTNYAINKENPNFQFNTNEKEQDVGHKRSLTSILKYLKKQGHNTELLMEQIKQIIVKTFCCSQPILAHEYKASQPDNYLNNMCFELLGFDILIDDKLKPFLIEINHTPSFATDTPLDSMVKKNAIRDALKLMNVSLKTRNETIAVRREIMQKRVLTGKKVKHTQEEKQQLILEGQKKRDEWENKNMGGYQKLYPLKPTVLPSEKPQEPESEKKENEDENETENKEPTLEEMYIQFQEYASKMYGISTGANIRRNTKKVLDQKEQQLAQTQKPLNQRTKDIEKIYNQKMNVKTASRSGTVPGTANSQTLTEKQQLQQQAMQRLSKGASSRLQYNSKRHSGNQFYEDHQLQPESGDEQMDYEINTIQREREFRIKSQQKNGSYSIIKRHDHMTEESKNALEENDENIPNSQYSMYQQPIRDNSRNDQKRIILMNGKKVITQDQQSQQLVKNQIQNSILSNSAHRKQYNPQSQTQGFPSVNGDGPSYQFHYLGQSQNSNSSSNKYYKPPYNNTMADKKQKIKAQKYQQYGGGIGGQNNQQAYNLYHEQNQKDGGLFVTPKLFDLNMLQKNYGNSNSDSFNNNQNSNSGGGDIYKKINYTAKKKDYIPFNQQMQYQQYENYNINKVGNYKKI